MKFKNRILIVPFVAFCLVGSYLSFNYEIDFLSLLLSWVGSIPIVKEIQGLLFKLADGTRFMVVAALSERFLVGLFILLIFYPTYLLHKHYPLHQLLNINN